MAGPRRAAREHSRGAGAAATGRAEGDTLNAAAVGFGRTRLLGGALLLAAVNLLWGAPVYWQRGAPATKDLLISYQPMHASLAHQGWPPLRTWEPGGGCGVPIFAESQASQLYPPSLAARALLDPDLGLFTLLQLHLLAAGIFMLVLGRELGLGLPSAWIAALAWMGGGFMVTHLDIPPMLFEASWLPAAAAGFTRHFRTGRLAPLGAAAAAVACMLLAGHFQVAAYACVLLAAWCAFAAPASAPGVSWRARVAALGVTAALAIGFAWAQLGATGAFLARSNRGELGGELWLSWSPLQVVTLVQPFLLGVSSRPVLIGSTPAALASWWGRGVYWETALYVGLVPLFLALATWPRRAERLRVFLWIALAVSLALAAGKYLPGGAALWRLPLWGAFRFPGRLLVLSHFCLALLAGLGMERLARLDSAGRGRWGGRALAGILVFVVALTAAWLAIPRLGPALAMDAARVSLARLTLLPVGAANLRAVLWGLLLAGALVAAAASRRPRLPLTWVLCAIAVADLTAVFRFQQVLVPPEFYTRPVSQPLACESGPRFRYFSVARHQADPVDHQLDLLPASLNLRTACSTVDFRGSLYDRRFSRFLAALMKGYTEADGRLRPRPQALPLFALAGVRELLRREPAEGPGIELAARAGPTTVYRLEGALPTLRRVGRARFVAGEEAAWRAVTSGSLVSGEEVVVETDGPASTDSGSPGSPGSVEILFESQERLEVETEGAGQGWLVRAQTWAPGWRAWLDGREQPVRRADYLFQAVAVPPGRHRVRLEYREPALVQGAVSAFLALLGWAALGWRDGRSRRQAPPEGPSLPADGAEAGGGGEFRPTQV